MLCSFITETWQTDLVKGRPLGPEALLLWIYSGLHFSPQHQAHTLSASCHSPSSRIPQSGRTLDHSDRASLSAPAKVSTSLKLSDISAGLKSTCQWGQTQSKGS